jgi:hypothetical protein
LHRGFDGAQQRHISILPNNLSRTVSDRFIHRTLVYALWTGLVPGNAILAEKGRRE